MATKLYIVPVLVKIAPPLPASVSTATVRALILPEETPTQKLTLPYYVSVKMIPIRINLSDPIVKSAANFITEALDRYIDEDRELKTLLNYGEDRQSVILAYRPGTVPRSLQLKLLQPVPDDVQPNHPSFLVREVVSSIIDKIRIRFAPLVDYTPYLRPLNQNVSTNVNLGKYLKNVTLRRLSLETGSFGSPDASSNISFEDQILRKWYSSDFNSSELNIDFTDYKNFVFYGSAELRLQAFKQKLLQLETLEAQRLQFSGSVFTGSLASAGATYIMKQSAELAKKKEDIIRAFDRYEQYLYFTPSGSDSSYSASFDYVDGGVEYHQIGYWPKDSSNNLYTVYSTESQEWFDAQREIAARYDEFNSNYLINTIPTHIREEIDNTAYITFVSMIGHFFDTIKPYIDQFPQINSRYIDPDQEISKDLVNEVAESLGFRMPTINSVYNLSDNILGTTQMAPRRDYTVETYKRLLHNLPLFAKAKGTRNALTALLRSLGITPQMISIRESGTPTTGSYTVLEEFATGIDFNRSEASYIQVPLSASLRSPKTLQVNVSITDPVFMTLMTGDEKWGLRIRPSTLNDNFGRIELISGSTNTILAETSYNEVYNDDLVHITIQANSTGSLLQVMKVDGDSVLFSDAIQIPASFYDLWQETEYVYIGGSGSLRLGGYDGTVDEVRLWGTNLDNSIVTSSAFNPGANFGNTYSDAKENLYVQISLNNETISGSYIRNESPYADKTTNPSLEWLFIQNLTTGSLSRYSRTVKQKSIVIGPSAFITNKIKVVPPPVFLQNSISADGSKLLSPTRSIVRPEQKRKQVGKNKISLGMSPTEIINQNIIKNIGYENLNRVLGLPSDYYTFDLSLDALKRYYNRYYGISVNFNQYIRIVSEISAIIDQVVDYFIPAKATLLKGITIEQNILEKIRIPSIKNIRGYGVGARKTIQAPSSLLGTRSDYGATFNVQQTIEVQNTLIPSAKVNSVAAKLETPPSPEISSMASSLQTGLSMSLAQEMLADYNTFVSNIDNTDNEIRSEYSTLASNVSVDIGEVQANTSTVTSIVTGLDIFTVAEYNTLASSIDQEIPKEIDGQSLTQQGTLDLYNNENIIQSNFVTYAYQHIPWETYRYVVDEENQDTEQVKPDKPSTISLRLDTSNKIKYNDVNKGNPGAEPYNRVYIRKLFDYEIQTPRNGGITSLYQNALYEIPPSTDFRDIGVTTYFNNPDGIYTFPETQKSPVYPKPLNQKWDNDAQTFIGITSWSYAQKYNIYDVVYQDVTADTMGLPIAQGEVTGSTEYLRLKNIVDASKAGNGKYYVFITRPSYTQPSDGTAYYLGQVPSYMPPSLDNINWQLLKFTPIEIRIPRRIVFDTFTIPDPSLNNFKTTNISVARNINLPDRFVDALPIQTIEANSRIVGKVNVQNMLALFALQANNNGLRIRIYRTKDSRDKDLERPINAQPTGSHGVLVDITLNTENALELSNPIPILIAGETPPKAAMFYTIDNLTNVAKVGTTLYLYYFALHIEPRIPQGYLKKHYRFYRDNSTATKRRNWLGCKNTIDTTIDGLPPVQVIISEGNQLTVAPTVTNEEIQTGGGGTLNVT